MVWVPPIYNIKLLCNNLSVQTCGINQKVRALCNQKYHNRRGNNAIFLEHSKSERASLSCLKQRRANCWPMTSHKFRPPINMYTGAADDARFLISPPGHKIHYIIYYSKSKMLFDSSQCILYINGKPWRWTFLIYMLLAFDFKLRRRARR